MSIIFDALIPFLIVLGILVFIHELGHHLAAKLFGMKVDAFSLGFPPRAWGFHWATKKLRPKFIKDITQSILSNTTFQSLDKEIQAAGLAQSSDASVKFLDTIFEITQVEEKIELIDAKGKKEEKINLRTELRFAESGPAASLTNLQRDAWLVRVQGDADLLDDLLKYGEINDDKTFHEKYKTDYCLSWVPLGGYCKINGMVDESLDEDSMKEGTPKPWEYRAKPIWQRMIVITGGVFFNFLLAAFVFTLMGLVRGLPDMEKFDNWRRENALPAEVGVVSPGSPADKAGIQAGDRIASINGQTVQKWDELVDVIRHNAGKKLPIEWTRGSERFSGEVMPTIDKIQTEKGIEEIGRIGIQAPPFPEFTRDASFIEAVQHGFITAVGATYFIVRSIKQMVSGEVNAKDALGGPLMIAKTTGDMKRQYGWEGIWNLMALLSLSLAVFNLLPVPALDGGHLFMLAIEGVMRRPLSLKVKLRAQQAGMAILLSLIVYIFFNDIVKLTGIF